MKDSTLKLIRKGVEMDVRERIEKKILGRIANLRHNCYGWDCYEVVIRAYNDVIMMLKETQ